MGNILCTGFEVNKAGVVTHVKVTVDRERTNKVKGHLTWVAGDGPGVEPTRAEVRWLVGWLSMASTPLTHTRFVCVAGGAVPVVRPPVPGVCPGG